ncbi:MAG: PP2C family protein-serine/threonine phosphatase [Acidimicrobiia bacterium]
MSSTAPREGSNTARGLVAQVLGWVLGAGGVAAAVGLAATDRAEVATALVIAGAALVISLVLSIALELRARAKLRNTWLRRLHQLAEDLAGAPDAVDPAAVVRAAGERAGDGVAAPRSMDGERLAYLRSVDDLCAQAHQRVELHRAEQRARADLERLAGASPLLAASLDVHHVTTTIEQLVVPDLAARCELRVLTGPRGAIAPARVDPEDRSTAVVPLVAADQLVGELVLRSPGGSFDPADLATVHLLAEPAARALAHAVRYSEEAHASATLQESLLPHSVLPVPGLEIATRYLAATEGQVVGGDFYDVIRRPDGTALLLVGDVQGKGIEAAALTSTARHTLRTAALAGESPAQMLGRVNEALLYADAERLDASGTPTVRFVTAAVVALEPRPDGSFAGVLASGGHPPPLLIRPQGAVEPLLADGPLLGVFADARFDELEVHLGLADVLVLYTDGVTERRQHPEEFDEHQLGRLVRNQLTTRRAEAVAQLVLDTVVGLSPRDARDDIALVVARVVRQDRS